MSSASELTPRQIAGELDKHVVGQRQAKRAVAIALRNRWRRRQLSPDLAEEVHPKNILMIGPTGVGKTEIARRLAKLAQAPFVKIEATKFTEVGYVGRDVESIVRDLMEIAIQMVREEKRAEVADEAARRAEDRLLQLLLPSVSAPTQGAETAASESLSETREKLRTRLQSGRLEDRPVTVTVEENSPSSVQVVTPQGVEDMGFNFSELLPSLFGKKANKEMTVREARQVLIGQEAERLIDRGVLADEARSRCENNGIVFLDEIDKVCAKSGHSGPDISREGVQRDLLPIVEGTTVTTKHGPVRTDHILFIAAGAFHVSKPSDMMPELQGRFPIRVELEPLTEEDLVRILTEPHASLLTQYTELLASEGVLLSFSEEAIREIAHLAAEVNSRTENIGARRLATLLERLLEELSFEASEMAGVKVDVDLAYVRRALAGIVADRDLSRYVL